MVLPLRELLEDNTLDLEALQVALKSFVCERDSDVQSFLHSKAIDYELKNKARTYLIIDDQAAELVLI